MSMPFMPSTINPVFLKSKKYICQSKNKTICKVKRHVQSKI